MELPEKATLLPNIISYCWGHGVKSYDDLENWAFYEHAVKTCEEQGITPEFFNAGLAMWDTDFEEAMGM